MQLAPGVETAAAAQQEKVNMKLADLRWNCGVGDSKHGSEGARAPRTTARARPARHARVAGALALAIGAIVLLAPGRARAEEDEWSYTLEVEHERITSPPPALWTDSLSAIVSYRFGFSQFDLKLEGDRDESYGSGVGGKVELRYRLHLPKALGFKTSLRVSLGEQVGPGAYGMFPFFTVQPKIAYVLPLGFEPYVSARYRDAFEPDRYFRTFTYYAGMAIPLGTSWEVEPSFMHKTGDECSNGMKLEISHSF